MQPNNLDFCIFLRLKFDVFIHLLYAGSVCYLIKLCVVVSLYYFSTVKLFQL